MVPTPTASAAGAVPDTAVSTASFGSPPRFAGPLPGALASARAYNCPAISTSPIPASIPWTTDTEMARNQRPRRSAPMAS